jgi:hypothetical protein
MGEFFKDGAYHITTDQKGDLKEFLLERMRKINNRTKTGKLSKTGTDTKTYIDGEEFVFKSQGGDAWSWRNKGGLSATQNKRNQAIDTQTVGKKDLPKTPSKALEVHHQRMVGLYSPLYEGLSEAEGLELSRYFAEDLNMPLGDKLANASTLPMKPHDRIHEFIDDNVRKNIPDFTDPRYSKVQLPDGEILEGIDARKFHAKNYFSDLVQPAIDTKTISLMQDAAKTNPKGYKGLYQHLLKDAASSKITKGLTKATSATSTAEALLLLGSGQVVPGSIALAMQTPAVQKQVAKKLIKPVGKLLAKQGLKMIPGVSIGSGILQSIGYLSTGQYSKAAISVGGGIIGEFGPAGDAVQAMIDLSLTAHDIKNPVKPKTTDVDSPNRSVLKTVKKTTKALTK